MGKALEPSERPQLGLARRNSLPRLALTAVIMSPLKEGKDNPTLTTVFRLAKALGVKVGEFFK